MIFYFVLYGIPVFSMDMFEADHFDNIYIDDISKIEKNRSIKIALKKTIFITFLSHFF